MPTPAGPSSPHPDPQRQPPWRQVAEGSLLSRWLSSPESGRPPQGYPRGLDGEIDPSAGGAVGGDRVPQQNWGPMEGVPLPGTPLDRGEVVAAGTPLGTGPVYSDEASLPGGGDPSEASQGGGPRGDAFWGSPVDGAGPEGNAPQPVEAALSGGPSGPVGPPRGSGPGRGSGGIRHWSSGGPGDGSGGASDGRGKRGAGAGRSGASGRGAGKGKGVKRTDGEEGFKAEPAAPSVSSEATLAETQRQPEPDSGDGQSGRSTDPARRPGEPVAAGARRAFARFSNCALRWSGMRWLAGDRGTEALSKRVELRGGTLVVFFLSTVVVTFLLAAAWIIPRPQRSAYHWYQRGDFPGSRGESGPSSLGNGDPLLERNAPASVDVGRQPIPIDDEAGALAVVHRERAQTDLPGKLDYWAPAERPFESSGGRAKGAETATEFRSGGSTGDLRELSAIKPRPKVSADLRVPEPPVEAAPRPPTAQYRVLVRSNADRRETEAFEAYFVKNLGLGCHLEEDGPAVGGEPLFRVFLDRKFATLRDASAFCREVKDVARATPFRSNYFLDALPLKGNW